jgi:hypothetical protein
MAYDIPRWLSEIALVSRMVANNTRIVRDDTNRERVFTDAEYAILQRWIDDAERMEADANTMLQDWTALPGENAAKVN